MSNGRAALMCAWVLGATGLVAACHGDAAPPSSDVTPVPHKRPPPVKRGPSPAELTQGMVEAVTLGKSTVPVDLKFDLAERPILGQPVDVSVAVMTQIEADSALLTAMGSDALQLPGFSPIAIPNADPTQVYRHTVRVVATQEGLQLLAISVALHHDDITETRTFSVPLIVAPSSAAAAGAGATGAAGTSPGR